MSRFAFLIALALMVKIRGTITEENQDSCISVKAEDSGKECPDGKEYLFYVSHDEKTNTCRTMLHPDCKGNETKFRSKKECEKACVKASIKDTKDSCISVLDEQFEGNCAKKLKLKPGIYYDEKINSCRTIALYNWCEGSATRFRSKQECEQACMKESKSQSADTVNQQIDETIKPLWSAFLYSRHNDTKLIEASDKTEAPGSCIPIKNEESWKECEEPNWKIAHHTYFYNEETDSCTFKAMPNECGGNATRFKYLNECEGACVKGHNSTSVNLPQSLKRKPRRRPDRMDNGR